ncbi:MAG: hypothetical protein SGI77_15140 [Pirellulaceae bacterium]|nr:hypothetical protein [Pirellulaceae bacterium]
MSRKAILTALVVALCISACAEVEACPFCSASAQTLRQDMQSMDVVGLGELIESGETDINGQGEFNLLKVWRGEALLKGVAKISAPYFGPGKAPKKFLLMGVGSDELLWSSPLPISTEAEQYLQKVSELPEDNAARLRFYIRYLENAESLLARDAYDEFAQTPYEDVKLVRDAMDRSVILSWIKDKDIAPDRKRLYYTMLGICGQPEDANLLESLMKSESPEGRTGLDALIACYLTLKSEAGLPLIEELFLSNTKCVYADTYAAVMALRFHGTDGGVLPRERVVKSMRLMLERPEFADLVIPDLARWQDWSQIDRLVKLFIEANEDTSWVRVPVVNYLRACPLPEAKEQLIELEKIDPKAVKRAATFFPIPVPNTQPAGPANNDTSFQWPTKPSVLRMPLGARGKPLLASSNFTVMSDISFTSTPEPTLPLNRTWLATVGFLSCLGLGLTMWCVISGGS